MKRKQITILKVNVAFCLVISLLTNQKIKLRAEDREFLNTCRFWGQGRGLELRSQGLQNDCVLEAKDVLGDINFAAVVVHNKINTFLSNIMLVDLTIDSYKPTFLSACFDNNRIII